METLKLTLGSGMVCGFQNNVNARTKFKYQLDIIKSTMLDGCIVKGDFNLDYAKVFDDNYCNKNLFMDFDDVLSEFNLVQHINFVTCPLAMCSSRCAVDFKYLSFSNI